MTNIKIQKSGGSILLDNYYENPSPMFKNNSKKFDFQYSKENDLEINNPNELSKNNEISQPDPTLVL